MFVLLPSRTILSLLTLLIAKHLNRDDHLTSEAPTGGHPSPAMLPPNWFVSVMSHTGVAVLLRPLRQMLPVVVSSDRHRSPRFPGLGLFDSAFYTHV